MNKTLLLSIIATTSSVSGIAADLLDSPGPGDRQQKQLVQHSRVPVVFNDPLDFLRQPLFASKPPDSDRFASSLPSSTLDAFSKPIRFSMSPLGKY